MKQRLPLALFLCALPLLAAAACGDGKKAPATAAAGDPGSSGTAVPVTVDRAASPKLAGPASKYSILLADVGLQAYITDIPSTYTLDIMSYGSSKAFDSPADGQAKLKSWGYVDGFETAVTPEGREPAILNGAYAIYVETHIFQGEDGAKKAYTYFVDRVRPNAQVVTAGPVGNESTAVKALSGKIASSNQARAIHQVVFRRGNMVGIVQTIGADTLMKVDFVRNAALIVDEKALGKRETIAPTPVPPKATRTASATAAVPTPATQTR